MSVLSVWSVLTVWSVVATALPAPDARTVSLEEALHAAVCPISVHIDEVAERVPRRIKMLKCAHTPNPVCREKAGHAACCRNHHATFDTQCMEVTDSVLVRYTGRGDDDKLHAHTVSVGCACMVRGHTRAHEQR